MVVVVVGRWRCAPLTEGQKSRRPGNGFCARPVKGYGQRPKLCKGQLPRASPPPRNGRASSVPFENPLCSRINHKSFYPAAPPPPSLMPKPLRYSVEVNHSKTLITWPLIIRVRCNNGTTYIRILLYPTLATLQPLQLNVGFFSFNFVTHNFSTCKTAQAPIRAY